MSWVEISAKNYQVRLYDKHPDNYAASFQLYVDGDRGFIHSLNGEGFYGLMPSHVREVFEKTGVTSMEAYVLLTHAKLLTRALRSVLAVEVIATSDVHDRTMAWIKLILK